MTPDLPVRADLEAAGPDTAEREAGVGMDSGAVAAPRRRSGVHHLAFPGRQIHRSRRRCRREGFPRGGGGQNSGPKEGEEPAAGDTHAGIVTVGPVPAAVARALSGSLGSGRVMFARRKVTVAAAPPSPNALMLNLVITPLTGAPPE